MIPTVGRMVYYKAFGTPGGEHPSVERAAIITQVVAEQEDGGFAVGLCVLNPTGMYFNPIVTQGPGPGQWDWMPFQKGQAAKTEALEREAKAMHDASEIKNAFGETLHGHP